MYTLIVLVLVSLLLGVMFEFCDFGIPWSCPVNFCLNMPKAVTQK